jgi:hypothetical protein
MQYPNFQHHPDGLIIIRKSAEEIYIDTIANFEADFGSAYSGLPDGYIGRYYEPGVTHQFTTGNAATPENLNWPEGDSYIAACDKLIEAKAIRKTPGKPTETTIN